MNEITGLGFYVDCVQRLKDLSRPGLRELALGRRSHPTFHCTQTPRDASDFGVSHSEGVTRCPQPCPYIRNSWEFFHGFVRILEVVIPIEVYNCIPGMLVLNTGLRGGWLCFWSLTDVIPGMT